ncbi:MAG: DUF4403 family protein [Mesorhizobium sp.]|nr:MAG: DUF4403 family protein [Mesorhizobium sp.]
MTIAKTRLLLLAPSVCISLAACNGDQLFQAPPHGGEAVPPPTISDSVITLVASIPYSALVQAGEAKVPNSVPLNGDGHVACMNIPFVNPGRVGSHQECFDKPYLDFRGAGIERVCINVPDIVGPSIGTRNQCADYHWDASVNKDGSLRIAKSGADIQVGQSVHITGKAGLGGDLARVLSLSGKSFDARVSPQINMNVGLDSGWCPIVKAAPVGKWVDSASVELVGRNCVGIDLGALGQPEVCAGPVNLGLADVLNGEFDKHRDDIQNAAQSLLPCDAVRSGVSKQWHPFSIKIDRLKQTPLFLNIEPKTAGFSGLIAEDDAIRMVVRVGATTVLSPSEIATTGTAIPPLNSASADHGGLDVNLQAIAPYDFLKAELAAALKGKTFKQNIASNTIEIRIDDVDLYPSNGSLAVGLKIDAKLPGQWFDTTGWVYLSGKPTLVQGGKAITVEGIHFATVIDNKFWMIVQSLFETEILSALKEGSKFDLTKPIDEAASQITTDIAKANVPGLKITAGTPTIQLTGVHIAPDNLVVRTKLALTFDTEITSALLK